MNYRFNELFDIPVLTRLCQSFSNIRGVGLALLDLEGNIHIACEWKEICTDFHRVNPESTQRCAESDTELANQLSEGKPYNLYHCKNGLVDVAVPIMVDGEHVANLFTGQFLEKEPDPVFFRAQANHFNFDEDDYLDALSRVPVQSEEETRRIVAFLVELAQVMGEMGLEKLRSLERDDRIRHDLEDKVRERTRALNNHSEQLRLIGQMQADFINETDPDQMYRKVLTSLQGLSNSPFGLIAELVSALDGQGALRVYSLSGLVIEPASNRRHGDESVNTLTFITGLMGWCGM